MQFDFHYHATFALARAAGICRDAATIIATAAQFTDDAAEAGVLSHPEGTRFQQEVTAHRLADLKENTDLDDQLRVWVPFHFLPAGEGEDLSARLVCGKNSEVAQEVVAHALTMASSPFALELLGITAHVYADTFAHFGFSGVSSRRNRVRGETIETDDLTVDAKVRSFFGARGEQGGLLANFRPLVVIGAVATKLTGALGHGAVGTCPDTPYLTWSYAHEEPLGRGDERVRRSNPRTYFQACEALFGMFSKFLAERPDLRDPGTPVDFASISSSVRAVLATRGKAPDRAVAWDAAVRAGGLGSHSRDEPATYAGPGWALAVKELPTLAHAQSAAGLPVYRFFQAAAHHRHYVLRQLLPQHGVVIV